MAAVGRLSFRKGIKDVKDKNDLKDRRARAAIRPANGTSEPDGTWSICTTNFAIDLATRSPITVFDGDRLAVGYELLIGGLPCARRRD